MIFCSENWTLETRCLKNGTRASLGAILNSSFPRYGQNSTLHVRYDGEHPQNVIRTIRVWSQGDVVITSQVKPTHIALRKVKKRLSLWLGCAWSPDKVLPVGYKIIARILSYSRPIPPQVEIQIMNPFSLKTNKSFFPIHALKQWEVFYSKPQLLTIQTSSFSFHFYVRKSGLILEFFYQIDPIPPTPTYLTE
jgi:hypothetical protein